MNPLIFKYFCAFKDNIKNLKMNYNLKEDTLQYISQIRSPRNKKKEGRKGKPIKNYLKIQTCARGNNNQ